MRLVILILLLVLVDCAPKLKFYADNHDMMLRAVATFKTTPGISGVKVDSVGKHLFIIRYRDNRKPEW